MEMIRDSAGSVWHLACIDNDDTSDAKDLRRVDATDQECICCGIPANEIGNLVWALPANATGVVWSDTKFSECLQVADLRVEGSPTKCLALTPVFGTPGLCDQCRDLDREGHAVKCTMVEGL